MIGVHCDRTNKQQKKKKKKEKHASAHQVESNSYYFHCFAYCVAKHFISLGLFQIIIYQFWLCQLSFTRFNRTVEYKMCFFLWSLFVQINDFSLLLWTETKYVFEQPKNYFSRYENERYEKSERKKQRIWLLRITCTVWIWECESRSVCIYFSVLHMCLAFVSLIFVGHISRIDWRNEQLKMGRTITSCFSQITNESELDDIQCVLCMRHTVGNHLHWKSFITISLFVLLM